MITLKLPERPEQFSVFTIQFLILVSNAGLFLAGLVNKFTVMSVAIIFSLFILQVINHRFLLIGPVNIFMGRFVKAGDTIILILLIMISIWFLFIGVARIYIKNQNLFKFMENDYFFYITSGLFLVLLPLFWLIIGYKWVRRYIVKKLKEKPFVVPITCPNCKGKAEEIHRIEEWDKGIVQKLCYGKCVPDEKKESKVILEFEKILNIAS